MEALWAFAKDFLATLPGEVIRNEMRECAQSTVPWDGGLVLKKLEFPRSREELEVLKDLLGLLEDQSEMQTVFTSSVEDYVDDTYCRQQLDSPTCTSYFN